MAPRARPQNTRPANGSRDRQRRGGLRREMMITAAAELFRKKGFRGTGIEDIGAAVGTSGPAIYRHFPSKEAILVELLERSVQRAQRDVLSVLAEKLPPEVALREIVDRSVAHVIDETDLVALADQEMRSLSPEARRRLRRKRAAILGEWVRTLQGVRPDLPAAEARSVCLGVFALITSLSRSPSLAPDRARRLFSAMAMAALLAPPPSRSLTPARS